MVQFGTPIWLLTSDGLQFDSALDHQLQTKVKMLWLKNEISEIRFPFLHDAIYSINRIVPSFRYVYMDGNGGVALRFDEELTEEQIKGVRFELRYFGPYSAAPIGPSGEELKYGQTHSYTDNLAETYTQVFSDDDVDYREL